MSDSSVGDDHAEAARIARLAGEALLRVRREGESRGADGIALGEEGDLCSHRLIVDLLAEVRPGDAVLSEESSDNHIRLGSTRVWIVDPLDGTREFSESGRSDWAVHVALVEGGTLVAAAVALPARSLVLSTGRPPTVPPRPPTGDRPRLVVSRTRPPMVTAAIQRALDAVLVPMGSAGAKAMAVVLGEADVYAHAGGQYEWDSAAPVGVAAAAGLHVSRLDGSPLRYNQPDPWLPDVLICRPELAEQVIAAAAADGGAGVA